MWSCLQYSGSEWRSKGDVLATAVKSHLEAKCLILKFRLCQCVTSGFTAELSEIIHRIVPRRGKIVRGKSWDFSERSLCLFFYVRLSFLICLFRFLLSLSLSRSLIGRNTNSVVVDEVNFALFQQLNLVIAKKISYTGQACVCCVCLCKIPCNMVCIVGRIYCRFPKNIKNWGVFFYISLKT